MFFWGAAIFAWMQKKIVTGNGNRKPYFTVPHRGCVSFHLGQICVVKTPSRVFKV